MFSITNLQKTVSGAKLVWGPFHIPEVWGILLNGYAVVYMTIVVLISFWLTEVPVNATNMNFAVGGIDFAGRAVLYVSGEEYLQGAGYRNPRLS